MVYMGWHVHSDDGTQIKYQVKSLGWSIRIASYAIDMSGLDRILEAIQGVRIG